MNLFSEIFIKQVRDFVLEKNILGGKSTINEIIDEWVIKRKKDGWNSFYKFICKIKTVFETNGIFFLKFNYSYALDWFLYLILHQCATQKIFKLKKYFQTQKEINK